MNQATLLITFGRCLLALYFLLPGVLKFVSWDTHIALMQAHDMAFAPYFLAAAASLQIACSLAIMANKVVFYSSLILAAMVLAINFNLHDFWNYSDAQGRHELQNFIKNLGIFSGLLILAGLSGNSGVNKE